MTWLGGAWALGSIGAVLGLFAGFLASLAYASLVPAAGVPPALFSTMLAGALLGGVFGALNGVAFAWLTLERFFLGPWLRRAERRVTAVPLGALGLAAAALAIAWFLPQAFFVGFRPRGWSHAQFQAVAAAALAVPCFNAAGLLAAGLLRLRGSRAPDPARPS